MTRMAEATSTVIISCPSNPCGNNDGGGLFTMSRKSWGDMFITKKYNNLGMFAYLFKWIDTGVNLVNECVFFSLYLKDTEWKIYWLDASRFGGHETSRKSSGAFRWLEVSLSTPHNGGGRRSQGITVSSTHIILTFHFLS